MAALAGLIAGGRGRHDAGLVAFYLVALSLGVLLVAWRGSNVDVMRVLFGTVLAIDRNALVQIAAVEQRDHAGGRGIVPAVGGRGIRPAFLRSVGSRMPYGAVFMVLVVLALVASFQAFGTLLAVGPCCCRRRRHAAGGRAWRRRWRWRRCSGCRIVGGPSGVLSWQSALGSVHRAGGGNAVRGVAGHDECAAPDRAGGRRRSAC